MVPDDETDQPLDFGIALVKIVATMEGLSK